MAAVVQPPLYVPNPPQELSFWQWRAPASWIGTFTLLGKTVVKDTVVIPLPAQENDAKWQGVPRGVAPIINDGQLVKAKQWRYDYVADTFWGGASVDSASIQLLTAIHVFGAGGQAPTRDWAFVAVVPDTYWVGSPTVLPRFVLPVASPFFRQWRFDYVTDAVWWRTFSHNASLSVVTTPLSTVSWSYNYATDALWSLSTYYNVSLGALLAGKTVFRDIVGVPAPASDPFWTGAPLSSYLTTHLSKALYQPSLIWTYSGDLGTGWTWTPPGVSAAQQLTILYNVPPQWPTEPDVSVAWNSVATRNVSLLQPEVTEPFSHQWRYDYAVDSFWVGAPTDAQTLQDLSFAPTFKTKQWHYDYSTDSLWIGTSVGSQTLQNASSLTEPFSRQWRYDYAADSFWAGVPVDAQTLQNLSFAPTSPTRQWRWDHDNSTAFFQFFYQRNFGLLSLTQQTPARPPQWLYEYDSGATQWLARPLASYAPALPQISPFSRQWRFDFAETAIWTGGPASYTLRLAAVGQAPQRVWGRDYGSDAGLWLGQPRSSAIPRGASPTAQPAWRPVPDAQASWSPSARGNPLLFPPPPPVAQILTPQWRYDYVAEPVWLGESIRVPTAFMPPLRTDPRFVTRVQRVIVTVSRDFMPQGNNFSPIDVSEVITGTFDFGPWLPAGTTIQSVENVSCAAVYGTDAGAAARLIGTPVIGVSPLTGNAASALLQQWGTMIADVTYVMVATVNTSDGQQLTLWAYQPCEETP